MSMYKLKTFACGLTAVAIITGSIPVTAEDPDPNEQVVVVVKAQDGEREQKSNQSEEETEQESPLWLGIMLKEVEGDLATYLKSSDGILVDAVFDDSPAAKAGIQVGDVLLSIDDKKLAKPASLLAIMRKLSPQAEESVSLTVTLLRNGEKQQVQLSPTKRPQQLKIEETDGETADSYTMLWDGDKTPEEIQDLMKRLGEQSGGEEMNIFRFGSPSIVWDALPEQTSGDIEVQIKRSTDGEKLQLTVQMQPNKPAKITVQKGDEVKQYSEQELDDLPEDVRTLVVPMLNGQKGKNRGMRLIRPTDGPGALLHEKQREELGLQDKKLVDQYRARALEMAERSRAKAEQLAKAARESAEQTEKTIRAVVSIPDEMKELRDLVESLSQEVEQLRAELERQKE